MFQSVSDFGVLEPWQTFCRKDNFASAVTYLSRELELLGYSPLVPDGHDKLDVICLINATYDLMNQVKQHQTSKKEAEDRTHKILTDLQHCQWQLLRQKETSAKRERELAELAEKERQTSGRLRQNEALLKKNREEMRQLMSDAELKQNQWQHALRRRDLDNHRLHDQLVKFLRNKSRTCSTSGANSPLEIEIRGSLNPPDPHLAGSSHPPRRKWGKAQDVRKPVEDKWRLALAAAEMEQQTLRQDYCQMGQLVGKFMSKMAAALLPDSAECFSQGRPEDWLQLPISTMGHNLEEYLVRLEELIEKRIKQSEDSVTLADRSGGSQSDSEALDQIELEKQRVAIERAALDHDRIICLAQYLQVQEDRNANVTLTAAKISPVARVKSKRNVALPPPEFTQLYRGRSSTIPSGSSDGFRAADRLKSDGLNASDSQPSLLRSSVEPAEPRPPHPSNRTAEPTGTGEYPDRTSGATRTSRSDWPASKSRDSSLESSSTSRSSSSSSKSSSKSSKPSDNEELVGFVRENTIISKSITKSSTGEKTPASCKRNAPERPAAFGHQSSASIHHGDNLTTLSTKGGRRRSSSSSSGSQDSHNSNPMVQPNRSGLEQAPLHETKAGSRVAPQTSLSVNTNATISAKVSFIQEAVQSDIHPTTDGDSGHQIPAGMSVKCLVSNVPLDSGNASQ